MGGCYNPHDARRGYGVVFIDSIDQTVSLVTPIFPYTCDAPSKFNNASDHTYFTANALMAKRMILKADKG